VATPVCSKTLLGLGITGVRESASVFGLLKDGAVLSAGVGTV
jgi:hypothetical protein